ncbi:hypothetical protein ACO2Q9_03850 [Variovorax sp. VNK109]|uniref:hypothetical protein n=1 Tax=Variovorax sp. VNK109 TaxID=3400919 RepID=UPI003C0CB5FC
MSASVTLGGHEIPVTDSSCSAVAQGMATTYPGTQGVTCSDNPIKVGTVVNFTFNGGIYQLTAGAVNAPAPSTPQSPDQDIHCATSCTVTVKHELTWPAISLEQLGVTPGAIANAYAWGFGAVFSMWVIGYCVGLAVGLIRKA